MAPDSVTRLNHRLSHLDLMRGLAALMVCASHLRAFLLVDSARVHAPGLFGKGFYFISGLGHQSVVVFFVLSGFFVGGGVVRAFAQRKWSWQQYAIRRLSRLWIVLVPALLLTLILDQVGRHFAPGAYQGAYHDLYHSGPGGEAPGNWSAAAFLGNAFFLQTIVTPIFGTNDPVWSLANEFWYYLLFPLLFGVIQFPKWAAKLSCLALALVLLAWLPPHILYPGLIWLMGVVAFLGSKNAWVVRHGGRLICVVLTGLLALAALGLTKTSSIFGSDYVLGIAFALFITSLSVCPTRSVLYQRFANFMGETTYTLYLTHFPLLALIIFTGFHGVKLQPDLAGAGWFLGLLVVVLIYTTAVWWCFERNTEWLRKKLEASLAG